MLHAIQVSYIDAHENRQWWQHPPTFVSAGNQR